MLATVITGYWMIDQTKKKTKKKFRLENGDICETTTDKNGTHIVNVRDIQRQQAAEELQKTQEATK